MLSTFLQLQVATILRATAKTISRIVKASVINRAASTTDKAASKDDKTISRASAMPHRRKFIIRINNAMASSSGRLIKAARLHLMRHSTRTTDHHKEEAHQADTSSGRRSAVGLVKASAGISPAAAAISDSTLRAISSSDTSAQSLTRSQAHRLRDMAAVIVANNLIEITEIT